jgi:hypothetical protein
MTGRESILGRGVGEVGSVKGLMGRRHGEVEREDEQGKGV